MKSLLTPIFWGIAAIVAGAVIYRLWRGQNVMLRGKVSPRIVRMAAILLVTLGFTINREAPQAHAAPVDIKESPGTEELPKSVSPGQLEQWHMRQAARDPWMTFKQRFTVMMLNRRRDAMLDLDVKRMPPVLASHFRAEIAAIEKCELIHHRAADLLAVLDEAEKHGYYDHWLNAHLWRKSELINAADRPEVFARLHRNARVTDALIRSFAEVKPTLQVSPRAWMSKSGPGPAERQAMQRYQNQLKEIFDLVAKLFPVLDEGTWKRDGVTRVVTAKDSAILEIVRGKRRQACPAGEEFRFGRLDAVITPAGDKPAAFDHAWLGRIDLPAGRIISVWDLPSLLSRKQRAQVDRAVAAAMAGDENEADKLESALPFTHSAVRGSLKASPQARFAPRLRLILALFDDCIMPALPDPRGGDQEEAREQIPNMRRN